MGRPGRDTAAEGGGRAAYAAAVELRAVETERERDALRRLVPLYVHDLSRYTDHYRLDADGRWQPDYVDDFLARPACSAYLIRVARAAAGFAWVGAGDFPRKRPDRDLRLAELFVAAPFRRAGVGRAAADAVLARHTGTWQLEVVDGNDAALAFWRAVLEGRGHREEPGDDRDRVFLFET
jgi:predicted acetyltransferase